MSAILRGAVSRGLPVFKTPLQIQKATVISGPPKNRMPLPEKLVMGGVMIAITISPAAWILMNLQEYKKRE